MKRFFTISLAFAAVVALAGVPAFAQVGKQNSRDQGKDGAVAAAEAKASDTNVVYTGWIVDEWCGAKNANSDGKTCALECHQKGAKLVLYVPASKTTVPLDDQEKASKNVGVEVRVKGTMDGDTLKVSTIESAKKS